MPKKPKSVHSRDAHATQQKILAAAEAEFAEKGFDGGRVDEIARRAGVNKAMLYYYFQSKEQLLRTLTKKHFKEIAEEKKRFFESLSFDEAAIAKQFGEHSMKIFSKHKSFLRILLIEALKNDEFAQELFRIIDAILPHLDRFSVEKDLKTDMLNQFKTNIFFFGFTPLLMYLTIGESWTEYAGLDQQTFRQIFLEQLQKQKAHNMQNLKKRDQ